MLTEAHHTSFHLEAKKKKKKKRSKNRQNCSKSNIPIWLKNCWLGHKALIKQTWQKKIAKILCRIQCLIQTLQFCIQRNRYPLEPLPRFYNVTYFIEGVQRLFHRKLYFSKIPGGPTFSRGGTIAFYYRTCDFHRGWGSGPLPPPPPTMDPRMGDVPMRPSQGRGFNFGVHGKKGIYFKGTKAKFWGEQGHWKARTGIRNMWKSRSQGSRCALLHSNAAPPCPHTWSYAVLWLINWSFLANGRLKVSSLFFK